MVKWREAYDRCRGTPEFGKYFGGTLPMGAFRFLAYSQQFTGVTGSSTPGIPGPTSGPTQQNFASGAIILGITAGAFQQQQAFGDADYAPSLNSGRRDIFCLAFQYSNNEQITPNGLTMAEALLGSGYDTVFPAKEIMVPPSQSLLCSVAALTGSSLHPLSVHVVYHAMVPRAAG